MNRKNSIFLSFLDIDIWGWLSGIVDRILVSHMGISKIINCSYIINSVDVYVNDGGLPVRAGILVVQVHGSLYAATATLLLTRSMMFIHSYSVLFDATLGCKLTEQNNG
jgi:hypothetical protein